jgi:hypothetical protein
MTTTTDCPWCNGTGLYVRAVVRAVPLRGEVERVPCQCGPPVTGTGRGLLTPSPEQEPPPEYRGPYVEMIDAFKAAGAVLCHSCQLYLYPDHQCRPAGEA